MTIFEPNWDGFTVRSERGKSAAGGCAQPRHPDVGGALCELLEAAGCIVLDRVEELSVWRSLDVLDGVVGIERSIANAVQQERISQQAADRWLTEQRDRDAAGVFHATMPKVLVVTRRP